MCDDVIIHNKDFTEKETCETQKDLMEAMPNGIWLEPPPTPAEQWRCYTEDSLRWARIYEAEAKREGKLPNGYSKTFALPYPFAFIPVFQVPLHFHDPLGDIEHGFSPECCLCPVDLEKTARMNGYEYSKEEPDGEYDPFNGHFYIKE